MKRVLVLSYSQSGQTREAVRSLVSGLDPDRFAVTEEVLRTSEPFPFPWSLRSFFGVMPECVLARPPALVPPSFAPDDRFDLVILAWQVWFLSPSLPIQAFLASPWARVLRDTPVVSLTVCRNMWHTASETMKRLVASAGGRLVDGIVLTDQGPPWAGFVTTPRYMLTGRRDPFLGLPPAGVSEEAIRDCRRFGEAIGVQEDRLALDPPRSLLAGMGAVPFERRYVIPELIGRFSFRPWARWIRWAGPRGSVGSEALTALFVAYLVLAILLLVPAAILATAILYPAIRRPFRSYEDRIKSPSGVDPSVAPS